MCLHDKVSIERKHLYTEIMRSNGSIRYAPAGVPISTSLVIRGGVLHHVSIIDVCHDETMITCRIRHAQEY